VAVQEPDAWVIGLNGDHHISSSRQQGNVSTGRIGGKLRLRAVELAGTLGKNKEVVSVNVDWVCLAGKNWLVFSAYKANLDFR